MGMAHFWTSKKTSVEFGNGTLLDHCCRLHKIGCHKKESNSRPEIASLVPNHYANSAHEQL